MTTKKKMAIKAKEAKNNVAPKASHRKTTKKGQEGTAKPPSSQGSMKNLHPKGNKESAAPKPTTKTAPTRSTP